MGLRVSWVRGEGLPSQTEEGRHSLFMLTAGWVLREVFTSDSRMK